MGPDTKKKSIKTSQNRKARRVGRGRHIDFSNHSKGAWQVILEEDKLHLQKGEGGQSNLCPST